MRDGWRQEPEVTGACQCGAVRFTIAAGPAKSTVCHCRMCQRAAGNAFAPLLEVMHDAVTWHGAPAVWASSNLAKRGFCATCGTPVFYRGIGRDTVELMAGTLDPAFRYDPIANHGVEARVGWLAGLGEKVDRETFLPEGATVISCQCTEGAAAGAANNREGLR
jgi:hypothetical protein